MIFKSLFFLDLVGDWISRHMQRYIAVIGLLSHTLGSKFVLEKFPESFHPIDVVSFAIAIVPLSVIYLEVNIPSCRISGIRRPGVGTDGRALLYHFGYQWEKSGPINIFDNFSPNLAVPAEDPIDRLFRGPNASFCSSIPDNFPFILPVPSRAGFSNVKHAGKDIRNIRCRDHANV